MSSSKRTTTPSSELGKTNQGGVQQPKWTTRRVSGSNGDILHLSEIGGREAAAKKVGKGYKGWFVEEPGRTFHIVRGTLEDLAGHMQRRQYEAPVRALVVAPPKALVPYGMRPGEWRITDRAALWTLKQKLVDDVKMKHHIGTDKKGDAEKLVALSGPMPAPTPIDVPSEVEKIRSALYDTHSHVTAVWNGTPIYFRSRTQRQYRLKEGPNGTILLKKSKNGPHVVVGRIQRPEGTWVITRMGLTRALREFVLEVGPGLALKVAAEVEAAPALGGF